jgi:hypothetical protein
MAVAGIILLLPGVCALGFMVTWGLHGSGPAIGLWLVCFMVAAPGALLLYSAFRKPPPPNP